MALDALDREEVIMNFALFTRASIERELGEVDGLTKELMLEPFLIVMLSYNMLGMKLNIIKHGSNHLGAEKIHNYWFF